MNNLINGIEKLYRLPTLLESACLILVLLLLLRWLQNKRVGTPLDSKRYLFLFVLVLMIAITIWIWQPDNSFYANLLAILGVIAGGILAWGPVSEKNLSKEEYQQLLRDELQQFSMERQNSALTAEEHQLLEQRIKGLEEKSVNLQQSYEEEIARRKSAEKALVKMEGQLSPARIAEAKKSLAQRDTQTAEQAFDEVVDKEGKFVALAAYQSGQLAEGRVDYAKAMRQYTKAVTLEEDNPDYLLAAGRLAWKTAAYKEAEDWWGHLLEIRETEGEENAELGAALSNLAQIYTEQGRYDEAEPLHRRSLVIKEKVLGQDHPEVAATLNNLALLHHAQGRYEKAEPLYKRSLEIRENKLGKNHPDVAQSLNNLAGLYKTQGRYEKAEPMYQRSLEIREDTLEKDHPDVATSLNNMAELYRAQSQYEKAEPLYKRSIEIKENKLGKNHPSVATSLNNLAALYESQGRYKDAESLYKRALKICEKTLGKEHPHVATTLNNLALLHGAQGRYEEAEPLYQRAITIMQAKFPNGHPNLDTIQANYDALKKKMAEKQ